MEKRSSSSKRMLWVVIGLWLGVLAGGVAVFFLAFGDIIQIGGNNPGSGEVPLAKLESGTLATDFDLENVAGGRIKLSDQRGKVVVFNFWATWCGPCIQEMPMFQEYQEKYPDLVMIGINEEETADQVRTFLEKMPLTYYMLLDPDTKVAADNRVMLLPTTIFIDEKGEIRFRHYGIMSEDQFEYYLQTLGVIPQ